MFTCIELDINNYFAQALSPGQQCIMDHTSTIVVLCQSIQACARTDDKKCNVIPYNNKTPTTSIRLIEFKQAIELCFL